MADSLMVAFVGRMKTTFTTRTHVIFCVIMYIIVMICKEKTYNAYKKYIYYLLLIRVRQLFNNGVLESEWIKRN